MFSLTGFRKIQLIILCIVVSACFASHGWDTWNVDIIGRTPAYSIDNVGNSRDNTFFVHNGLLTCVDFVSHEDYIVFHEYYDKTDTIFDMDYTYYTGYRAGKVISIFEYSHFEKLFVINDENLDEIIFDDEIDILSAYEDNGYLYCINRDSLFIFELDEQFAYKIQTYDVSGDFVITSDSILFVHDSETNMFTKFNVSDPLSLVITWQDTMTISYKMAIFEKLIIRDPEREFAFRFFDIRSDSAITLEDSLILTSESVNHKFLNDTLCCFIEGNEIIKYNINTSREDVLYSLTDEINGTGLCYKFGILVYDSTYYGYNSNILAFGINDSSVHSCPYRHFPGWNYKVWNDELCTWDNGDNQLYIYNYFEDSTIVYYSNVIDSFYDVLYLSDDTLITTMDYSRINIYNRVECDSFELIETFDSTRIWDIEMVDGRLVAHRGRSQIKFIESWSTFWEDTSTGETCSASNITLNDSLLCVYASDSIKIYDIDDLSHFEYLSAIPFYGRFIDDIKLYDEKLFLLEYLFGSEINIFAYDISTPETPVFMGTIRLNPYTEDFPLEVYSPDYEFFDIEFSISSSGVLILYTSEALRCYDINEFPEYHEVGYAFAGACNWFSNVKFSSDRVYLIDEARGTAVFDISYFTDPSSRESVTYESETGWNLLSNPFEDYMLSENLFTTPTETFEYEPSIRTYNTQDTLANGAGFWAFSPEFPIGGVYGWELAENTLWDLYIGWNIIGASGHPIAVSDIDTSRIIMPIYGYDIIGRSYFEADTLYPTKGYWIMSPERQYLEIE